MRDDPDRDFILNGLRKGFNIIDTDAVPSPVQCENHSSARPGSRLYGKATDQILREIRMGHYQVVHEPPEIIIPIGVLPKPDGGVS